MFCPSCNSEYRPGFTRCGSCDVDLIDTPGASSSAPAPAAPLTGASNPASPVGALVDYCGFLSLDEARGERDRLRQEGILARISLRESPPGSLDGPVEEEAWLLVPRERVPQVAAILGYDAALDHGEDDGGFACNACGTSVGADEDRCPSCGARFEDGP